jgi:hypothetical protein
MKNFFPLLMAAILAMALGCNEGTPGGPGVKQPGSTTSSTTATPSTTTPEIASAPSYSSDTPTVTEKPPVTTAEPAPGTDANPIAGDPENSFRLDAPNLATTIKQGETKVVTIGISRAKNFDQDVALKLEGVPKGVTIDPAEPMIKHGEKEVKLNVTAAEDAALNDFTVKVVGHPDTGADATNEFKISITKP